MNNRIFTRLAAALGLAAASAGCASWESRTVVVDLGAVPVEQAIGLTREQFEARLGIGGAFEDFVWSAALEDDVIVERVPNAALAAGRTCANGGYVSIVWRQGDYNDIAPPAMFRDGRYAGPDRDGLKLDQRSPAVIAATCTSRQVGGRDVAGAIFLAPVALTAAVIAGPMFVTLPPSGGQDINAVLATLPLGAAPPGGLDAFVANLPPAARLIHRDGAHAEIALYYFPPTLKDPVVAPVTISIVDGRVAKLAGNHTVDCILTRARTFECGTRKS